MLEEVYSDHALSKSQCYRWFKKFQSGDFELDNEPHGKPPQKFEDAELQALLDEDSTQMQEKLAKQLQFNLPYRCYIAFLELPFIGDRFLEHHCLGIHVNLIIRCHNSKTYGVPSCSFLGYHLKHSVSVKQEYVIFYLETSLLHHNEMSKDFLKTHLHNLDETIKKCNNGKVLTEKYQEISTDTE
ncbi:hypothetical protein LAZ67_5001436 [Cordylochernes scorpioides]|uniref:Mos1 transposase HTH domain-containing protein n=1 Tax=Cordylochernes scorpioides TaxID=51811 RepID=A0ABY6KFL6_9ARAC|nr:hypothetical protein LAZ67_5001436 [Cordylochernes scorpioides]